MIQTTFLLKVKFPEYCSGLEIFAHSEYELIETDGNGLKTDPDYPQETGSKRSASLTKRISLNAAKAKRARGDNDENENNPDVFQCEICGDKYDSQEKLSKHLASNKVWNDGACFKCAKSEL